MMLATLWVAIGGAIGSVARFWLTEASAKWWGADFPGAPSSPTSPAAS